MKPWQVREGFQTVVVLAVSLGGVRGVSRYMRKDLQGGEVSLWGGMRVRATEAEDEVLRDQNGFAWERERPGTHSSLTALQKNQPRGHLALRPSFQHCEKMTLDCLSHPAGDILFAVPAN